MGGLNPIDFPQTDEEENADFASSIILTTKMHFWRHRSCIEQKTLEERSPWTLLCTKLRRRKRKSLIVTLKKFRQNIFFDLDTLPNQIYLKKSLINSSRLTDLVFLNSSELSHKVFSLKISKQKKGKLCFSTTSESCRD